MFVLYVYILNIICVYVYMCKYIYIYIYIYIYTYIHTYCIIGALFVGPRIRHIILHDDILNDNMCNIISYNALYNVHDESNLIVIGCYKILYYCFGFDGIHGAV